jgi:hypothetical protein
MKCGFPPCFVEHIRLPDIAIIDRQINKKIENKEEIL